MKDKEKQIEKLQNILPHIETVKAMYDDIDFARYLYDYNCRIITEDSVVLSKEEYQKDFSNQFNKGYKIGSKETAEKILNLIDEMQKSIEPSNYYQHIYYERLGFEKGLIAVKTKIEKQFGVEIKE